MTVQARIDWLKQRQSGIGGSDIAAICGLNPFKTPLQVWQSKINPVVDEEISEPAYWGTTLENVVAQEYAKRTGRKVQRINQVLHHPHLPYCLANIDRAVVNPEMAGRVFWKDDRLTTNRILECKTANGFAAKKWGESGSDYVPDEYLVQCMWYMGITGADICDLAVLIGGQDFRIYTIQKDALLLDDLYSTANDFWQLVETRTEPDPLTYAECTKKWANSDSSLIVQATESLVDDLEKIQHIKAQIKELENQEDVLKANVLMAMQDAESLLYQGVKVATCKSQNRTSFDTKAFEKDYPDLYAKYKKTSSTRVLRII